MERIAVADLSKYIDKPITVSARESTQKTGDLVHILLTAVVPTSTVVSTDKTGNRTSTRRDLSGVRIIGNIIEENGAVSSDKRSFTIYDKAKNWDVKILDYTGPTLIRD